MSAFDLLAYAVVTAWAMGSLTVVGLWAWAAVTLPPRHANRGRRPPSALPAPPL